METLNQTLDYSIAFSIIQIVLNVMEIEPLPCLGSSYTITLGDIKPNNVDIELLVIDLRLSNKIVYLKIV